MNMCRLALLLVAVFGCSPVPHYSAVLHLAARCDSGPDLTADLNAQTRSLEIALEQAGVPYTRADGLPDKGPVSASPQMVFYSGHGIQSSEDAEMQLCIEPDRPSPLALLPAGSNQAATLVLNACHSAYVDPRNLDRTVSILSSSPVSQGVDSGFAKAVSDAIRSPELDANCDGIVTDIELYRSVERRIRVLEYSQQLVPQVELRSYPGLRRHARGQVPLPIRSRCRDIKSAPVSLLREGESVLAEALLAQQAFGQGRATTFPELGWDYIVLSRRADIPSLVEADVTAALLPPERQGMLRRFDGTLDEARAIALYAAFTEFYLLEILEPYVRISRLSDGYSIFVGRLDRQDIAAHFPYRSQQVADSLGRPHLIIRDRSLIQGALSSKWHVAPCETTTGAECFVQEKPRTAGMPDIPSRTTAGRP